MTKRGLGPIERGGTTLPFGKGAVAGGFVFLSGVDGAVDDHGDPVAGVGAQTELALERLRRYLIDAGSTLDDIVKVVWYVADRAHLADFFAAREPWLGRESPALVGERSFASTLVITGLATEQMLVEVDCISYAGQ